MSANFLDKSGLAAGLDCHTFYTVAPPPAPPLPVPIPLAPHLVASAHWAPSRSWRIAHTVTTEAWATLQSGWGMLLVPHCPALAAPPHPTAELVNLAALDLTSSAAPVLSAHSVTGEGTALCTAVLGCYGINLDCGDPPPAGWSHDFNLNSVKTSPTLGDYLGAIFSTVLSICYSFTCGYVIGDKIKIAGQAFYQIVAQSLAAVDLAIVQTVLDVLNATLSSISSWIGDPIAVVVGKIAGVIQGAADGGK